MNIPLFGTAGIRARYREELSPEVALSIARALAERLKMSSSTDPVIVGWDARLTSRAMASAVASGLMENGLDVSWLGLTTFPAAAKATAESGAAGCYVTASHNPPEYSGLKFFDQDGSEISREEEMALEQDFLLEKGDVSTGSGSLLRPEYDNENYADDLGRSVDLGEVGVRVVVDTGNGVASPTVVGTMKNHCKEVVDINSHVDGRFPWRTPEPSARNLGDTMRLVKRLGAGVGFAWDGDADRLAVIDGSGRFVPQYKVSAVIGKSLRARKAIISVDMGLGFEEALDAEVVQWKLGDLHSAYNQRKQEGWRADIFTEPWKMADPKWGPFFDGIRAALLFLKGVEEAGGVEQALEQVPSYAQSRLSITCPHQSKREVSERIAAHLRSTLREEILTEKRIDGIKLMLSGAWILIRPSGTEPKVRTYVEAKSESRVRRIDALITRFANHIVR